MYALIDFDGVICDMQPAWCEIGAERFGYDIAQPTGWDSFDGLREEDSEAFYRILDDPELYERALPMPGALESLAALTEAGIEWVVATSCTSLDMVRHKMEWLARWDVDMKPRRHGTWPDRLMVGPSKGSLGGLCLVDDGMHNINAWAENNIFGTPIVFRQPWNVGLEAPHSALVAGDWGSVQPLIEMMWQGALAARGAFATHRIEL